MKNKTNQNQISLSEKDWISQRTPKQPKSNRFEYFKPLQYDKIILVRVFQIFFK